MKNSVWSMTRTAATVGIAGRNSLLLTMLNMGGRARGKLTIVTQYPKAEQIISRTLFIHALHVTEVKVIAEDCCEKYFSARRRLSQTQKSIRHSQVYEACFKLVFQWKVQIQSSIFGMH